MFEYVKKHVFLIVSFAILISPVIYINRTFVVTAYLTIKDGIYPLKPGQVAWLSTQGNQIVDTNGHPLLLRGVNIASNNWSPQYQSWHPEAVQAAATKWHANIIRTRIFEKDYINNPAFFFRNLESEIIEPARKQGVYVILHPWLGDNVSLPTEHTKAMWTAIAKRYKNDPTIIYDLLAEPRNITFEELEAAYTDLIPAIRSVNPKALIFVTGLDWGRDINQWADNPLPYDNIVYRTNPYNKQGEIEGYFLRLVDTKPVFIGEFGISEDLTMTTTDVNFLLQLANTYHLGWTAWNFAATGCPCLLINEQQFSPSAFGQQVLQALAGDTTTLPQKIAIPDNTKQFYIYADFLDNGFTDYSWDILRNLTSKEKVFMGTSSFKADFRTNGGGIYLHSTRILSSSNYQNLILHLNGLYSDNLNLRFRTSQDELSNSIKLKNYLTGKSSVWQTITVPLSTNNLSTFSSIMLEPIDTTKPLEVIYLDEIYLE